MVNASGHRAFGGANCRAKDRTYTTEKDTPLGAANRTSNGASLHRRTERLNCATKPE